MTWLTPLTGLILAAAVVPPLVLLYFLKLRRKSQPIACTLLWHRSVEDLQANAPFQRLRRNLLLLLQLFVLLLLAASVAQPRLHSGNVRGGRLVVLVDTSASMSATDLDGETSRLEDVKEQLRERLETLYGGGLFTRSPGETMIIAFSDRAEVLCRFSSSKQQLLNAIDRIQPTDAETNIGEALKLARAYTTTVVVDGEARVVGDVPTLELYSDGRIADLEDQVLRGEQLNYYSMGSDVPDNVAITSISVERPYDRPTAVQVFIALSNYGTTEVNCDVQLSVDEAARSIREITLPAATIEEGTGLRTPGTNNIVFTPFEQPRDAVIEVKNLRRDDLAADNVAQLVVPPPKRMKVLLVAPRSELVRTALEGLMLERLDRVRSGDAYEALVANEQLGQYDVIVFDGYVPTAMPPARYLVFGDAPPVEGLNAFGEGQGQVVLEWRDDHPAMRFVALDNLYIAKFTLLEPADDVRVLAEGSSGPAMVAVSRGGLQLLYCPFDPLDSNWPLQRGFINFLLNAVEYLGQKGEALTSRGVKCGEPLSTRLPAGAEDIRLELPDGSSESLQPLDPSLWTWGPTRRTGIYRLGWDDPARSDRQERVFAVNLLSGTEGDLEPARQLTIGTEPVTGQRAEDASYTPLWPWAIGLALAVMMLEWWIYHRKAFI